MKLKGVSSIWRCLKERIPGPSRPVLLALFGLVCLSRLAGSPVLFRYASAAGQPPDRLRLANHSSNLITNRPISVGRPFVQGEIPNFAQASIDGTPVTTQCDAKNRWPDGSLKFAIVSFIVPNMSAKATLTVTFSNQPTGNNAGFLSQSDMLAPAYNFDGQIELTGAASPRISARSILAAAGSCSDLGADPDGSPAVCKYWLKGPIVTAVVIDDRSERKFDVNTDGTPGNPLHPIFEAWFYPQTSQVQLGYTLENTWASTDPVKSARDQIYSVRISSGAASPSTLFTSPSIKMTPRTAWHQTWCINGHGAGMRDECGPPIHIDNDWPYLAQTRALPHWDTSLVIAPSKIASEAAGFAKTNHGLVGDRGGVGFWPVAFDATGAGEPHGPLPTWDVVYLLSQCDAGGSESNHCGKGDMKTVVVRSADLGYEIPYFYREADANAGHGQHFDTAGKVSTRGRVVSINARTQVNLQDATVQDCPKNFPADWINFGAGGQDFGPWDGNSLDVSHWPNLAYVAYLTTGQYAYYEEQMMQSAYAQGIGGLALGATRGCASPESGSSRQGSVGFWTIDQERANDWQAREVALGAFIGVDGSPEQAYFRNAVNVNIACWEGVQDLKLDLPGYDAQWKTCSGHRRQYPSAHGTFLGSWTEGAGGDDGYQRHQPLNLSGNYAPASANANFQNAYSAVTIGWINDMGFCPGTCQILQFFANRYLNMALNPAANIYNLSDYVYPTLDHNGQQIPSWTENQKLYESQPSRWPDCRSISIDESYAHDAMAAMSFMTHITSSQGGYDGQAAYNKIRSSLSCINSGPQGNDFASGSPKWDITPRTP